jgi:hypothetical protein
VQRRDVDLTHSHAGILPRFTHLTPLVLERSHCSFTVGTPPAAIL